MVERFKKEREGNIFQEYLSITEGVVTDLGVENLASLIGEVERFSLKIPENRKFGETYEGSRFLKVGLQGLDCEIITCGTPEGESISGLGGLWPDENNELCLQLPRFITGPVARDNLEFLGYQMSFAFVEYFGMPLPEKTAIVDFYREGPWTEIQRHLWDISGGRVEIPTDKIMVAHESADNFLNREVRIVNGSKLFYRMDPAKIETLFVNDPSASGAQVAKILEYLRNKKGCKPEKVVMVAPMTSLYSTVCLAELLGKRGIKLVVFTGASILDINYGDEPEPGSLYYCPYPALDIQLANPEFREIYEQFHPDIEIREGIRCNWTESFLLSLRALMDSETELQARGLSNQVLRRAMEQVTARVVVDSGLDWRKLYSYAAKIQFTR